VAYFKDEAIKLLGAIPLNQVIEIDDPLNNLPPLPSTDENIPKIKTEPDRQHGRDRDTWNAKLKQFPKATATCSRSCPRRPTRR